MYPVGQIPVNQWELRKRCSTLGRARRLYNSSFFGYNFMFVMGCYIEPGQDYMNKRKRGQYKKILERSLSRLVEEASETLNGMSNEKTLFADPTDRASLESDRNFLLRIRDRERKLLVKIQEALKRIDEGTFGTCQECGDEISESRLKARPVATLCVECKRKQEIQEKMVGI